MLRWPIINCYGNISVPTGTEVYLKINELYKLFYYNKVFLYSLLPLHKVLCTSPETKRVTKSKMLLATVVKSSKIKVSTEEMITFLLVRYNH